MGTDADYAIHRYLIARNQFVFSDIDVPDYLASGEHFALSLDAKVEVLHFLCGEHAHSPTATTNSLVSSTCLPAHTISNTLNRNVLDQRICWTLRWSEPMFRYGPTSTTRASSKNAMKSRIKRLWKRSWPVVSDGSRVIVVLPRLADEKKHGKHKDVTIDALLVTQARPRPTLCRRCTTTFSAERGSMPWRSKSAT